MNSPYVVGISSDATIWPQGTGPLAALPWSVNARAASRNRRMSTRLPAPVMEFVRHALADLWQDVGWRERTRGRMTSRFFFSQFRPAYRDENRDVPRDIEWLIAERPFCEGEATKSWLSAMPVDTPLDQLVRLAKLRRRTEPDYNELRESSGLNHYEGRAGEDFSTTARYAWWYKLFSPPGELGFSL